MGGSICTHQPEGSGTVFKPEAFYIPGQWMANYSTQKLIDRMVTVCNYQVESLVFRAILCHVSQSENPGLSTVQIHENDGALWSRDPKEAGHPSSQLRVCAGFTGRTSRTHQRATCFILSFYSGLHHRSCNRRRWCNLQLGRVNIPFSSTLLVCSAK